MQSQVHARMVLIQAGIRQSAGKKVIGKGVRAAFDPAANPIQRAGFCP